jgi:hypothetical protein
MPKTYNTIPTTTTGSVYTAAAHNNIVTNVNNYRVPPACAAYNNATQSIANATAVAVALNAEYYDTDGMHDTVTNNSRITIATDGIYVVTGNVLFDIGGTGIRDIAIYKNGTTTYRGAGTNNMSASFFTDLSVASTMSLVAGDYIQLYVYHTQGTAINVRGDANGVHFAATWLGQVS